MFKTKTSFTAFVVVALMFGVYSFGGDLIYLVKRSMDERVSVLERKAALVDLYFASNGIDLERLYGNRVKMVYEDREHRREASYTNAPQIIVQEPATPLNQGRYMVTFKDGSQMVIVTFEKTTVSNAYNSFTNSQPSTDVYVFCLENGRRVNYPVKDVVDIKFISYNGSN